MHEINQIWSSPSGSGDSRTEPSGVVNQFGGKETGDEGAMCKSRRTSTSSQVPTVLRLRRVASNFFWKVGDHPSNPAVAVKWLEFGDKGVVIVPRDIDNVWCHYPDHEVCLGLLRAWCNHPCHDIYIYATIKTHEHVCRHTTSENFFCVY